MPLYDYECVFCGNKEEVLIASLDHIGQLPVCCGKTMLKMFPKPAKPPESMDNLPMTDPRYVELRQKQCGVDV